MLYYLNRNPGAVAVSDLAERIAAWENDVDVSTVTYKQRKRVYTSLHQTHLPKLDEAGIVAYDREQGEITLDERAADLDAYLEFVGERDVPWCTLYLGLSAASLAGLVALWVGLFPSSGLAFAGGVVLLFAVTAGVHAYRARRNHIGGGNAPLDVSGDE